MSDEKCNRCNAAIVGIEPVYLLNGQEKVCRNCHDAASPVCPHCGNGLKGKLPKTWSKCSSCGKRFWIDAEQWLFPTMLITPDQRKEIQEICQEVSSLHDSGIGQSDRKAAELLAQIDRKNGNAVIRSLREQAIHKSGRAGLPDIKKIPDEWLALTVEAFFVFKATSKVIGNYGITIADVFLICADNQAINTVDDLVCAAYQQALQFAKNDFQTSSQICFGLAQFCASRGRQFREYLRDGNRYRLLEYQQCDHIEHVRIISGDGSCRECQKLKNKVFAVTEAIDQMPLPCVSCETWYDEELYPDLKGWCRCCYGATTNKA